MGNSIHQLHLEQTILDYLQKTQASISAVSENTGLHYYTVRRIITSLVERGLVKIVGTQDRHKIYAYNIGSQEAQDHIPRIMDLLTKQNSKSIFILEATGSEDRMKSVAAAKKIVKHVAQLMSTANFADQGQDVNFRLDRIREEMQKDFLYLKNSAHIYEQILKEPRYWNPKFLAEMVNDPDYNYVEVQKAVEYYEQAD